MAENQYLICDCAGFADLEVFNESSNSNYSGLIIRGKFQEYGILNKNRRVYPESVLKPQVDGLQSFLTESGLLGELDHPSDTIIHCENASHLITKLWWDGPKLMGEARVLNTPAGKILEALIKDGVRVGVSSRGVGSGSLDRDGVTTINEGFKLITFDMVADPSTPGSYVYGSRNESKRMPVLDPKESVQIPAVIQQESSTKMESTCVDNVKKQLNPDLLITYFKALVKSKQ